MDINLELFIAASEGNVDAVLDSLERGGELEMLGGTDCQTPLIAAAAAGHSATVRALIRAGAQVNARDGEGNSALILAA